ncbi:endolytic transglycosylase MltG [Sneathiella limimaris]|uniref:endolytic transglycosylase MltG n=1 Tax=Sneathiella limimaris TaxID=1964213 RepID=UPI00146CEB70|nr:endolytic transglycosylase MltG [Sneathiella limimaris]
MKKFLIFLIALFLLFNAAIAGLIGYGWNLYKTPGPLQTEKILVLKKGSGLRQIATLLESENIIPHELAFILGVRLQSLEKKLKAGEYAFTPGMTGEQVAALLVSGKSVVHGLTIPEGLQSREVLELIKASDILTGDITESLPEGSILPETYHFLRGDTRDSLIQRMKQAFNAEVDALWQANGPTKHIKSKKDLITLASIVEKETGLASERPHVASVFLNRLERGMRLQSDPTVIYGVTNGQSDLGRPISKSDLAAVNDYNTYTRDGLPIGPICNPGLDSLKAVLNPLQTKDLYFVASGDGGHLFARTLKEHNRNVYKWRKLMKERQSN